MSSYGGWKNFNTSNVIFYLYNSFMTAFINSHFNTSNVIFYPKAITLNLDNSKFQYIQCYFLSELEHDGAIFTSISIHPMLFFIERSKKVEVHNQNFNTSNVIFYRERRRIMEIKYSFQYIQCYFLSREHHTAAHQRGNFNTSNVIFYQARLNDGFSEDEHFNTSNVIFYRFLM